MFFEVFVILVNKHIMRVKIARGHGSERHGWVWCLAGGPCLPNMHARVLSVLVQRR